MLLRAARALTAYQKVRRHNMSDERFDRIEKKLDGVAESVVSIDKTLALQHQSLELHIKRSDMLEAQLEPIKKHVAAVNGGLKFLGLLGVLGAIAEGLMSVLEYMKGR